MERHKLISIVVPVYNGEDFIEKAFQNIQKQKLPKEISVEVILVDNKSTDHSFSIMQAIASKESNVIVCKEYTKGAAAARNKGLSLAKGDFIYFYDVDDQLFDDTLSTLSKVLIDYPNCDAVFGKMYKSHQNVEDIDRKMLEETSTVVLKNKPYWGMKWFKDLSSVVGPPAFLYRKEVFKKIGNYEEELLTGQDTALDIKLGMSCEIASINKYVYLYYKYSASTTDHVKKSKSRELMQWPRLTKSHLPFYLEGNANEEFGKILYRKIFTSVGKMIQEEESKSNREKLKKRLDADINPLKTPWLINFFQKLLIIFPNTYLLKIYIYYIVPYSFK
ncbi:Glycosyl transferase family 2 [Mesonia phycicola]|uniref:Glycosyl transferase family 2 n=1 Tax=Mesonia phycicola TaxID=579105 RepID=A0A1M6AN73_9FLAO|nr:glycosyltransferase family 2 protein [Mesonia phycicola]SHI37643.1 Glycosyl transferase family 2 [Mesonia phycicola]